METIRVHRSPSSQDDTGGQENKNSGHPSTFHEAFIAFSNAKTPDEKNTIAEEWLILAQTLDEQKELINHLAEAREEMGSNQFLKIYYKLDRKIVKTYLSELDRLTTLPQVEAHFHYLDDMPNAEGECEIPTFRKWLKLASTKEQLQKLLAIVDEYREPPFIKELNPDHKENEAFPKLRQEVQDKLNLFD